MQTQAPEKLVTEELVAEKLVEPVVLTEADLALINARARLELMQVVSAQLLMSFVVALLAWLIGGLDAGWSALAGSAAYFVPNFLFALRLFLATFRPDGSSALVFLVGEFLKVGAAVGLLWLLAHVGGERVVWLAVIAGLIAALKGYMLVLMFGKRALTRPTNS
jgi:ATP synthase protein I